MTQTGDIECENCGKEMHVETEVADEYYCNPCARENATSRNPNRGVGGEKDGFTATEKEAMAHEQAYYRSMVIDNRRGMGL